MAKEKKFAVTFFKGKQLKTKLFDNETEAREVATDIKDQKYTKKVKKKGGKKGTVKLGKFAVFSELS
jgi:hypothetical protein